MTRVTYSLKLPASSFDQERRRKAVEGGWRIVEPMDRCSGG